MKWKENDWIVGEPYLFYEQPNQNIYLLYVLDAKTTKILFFNC